MSETRFEVYKLSWASEIWYWQLKHANGNIMAQSIRGFASPKTCKRSLSATKKLFNNAPIVVMKED